MKEEGFYKQIGKKIMKIREQKGYSRERLAEYANISSTFLYEIEMGRKGFTVAVLFRISNALGMDCNYFLKDENSGVEEGEIMEQLKYNKEAFETMIQLLNSIYEYYYD